MEDSSGNVNAPALSAGEFSYLPFQQRFQLKKRCDLCQTCSERLAANAVECCPIFQILQHSQLRIQHRVLKDHTQSPCDFCTVMAKFFSVHPDLSAVPLQLTAKHGNGGAFSGTVYAKKGKKLSGSHGKAEVVYCTNSAVALTEMPDFDDILRHGVAPSPDWAVSFDW